MQIPPALKEYMEQMQNWLPTASLGMERFSGPNIVEHGGIVTWVHNDYSTSWLIDMKPHLAQMDVALVAYKFRTHRERLGTNVSDRLLLLAPYIRSEQGKVLVKEGIDYLDLQGNVHLDAGTQYIHVEGKRPPKPLFPSRLPLSKAWVKTTMVLLIAPSALQAPIRTIAELAGVSTGTVSTVLKDLQGRGFITGSRGRRRFVDPGNIVSIWVNAYCTQLRPKMTERHLQLRVTEKSEVWQTLEHSLHEGLGIAPIHWALTGADAAELLNGHYHAEDTEIYVGSIAPFDNREFYNTLGAQPARRGNLTVIEVLESGAIWAATKVEGIPLAPPLLVYAELKYRGTDQALEAANMILPKMLEGVQYE